MRPMLLAFGFLCVVGGRLAVADAPNVLIILSDDHGYRDVGFNGGTDVPTPRLDALARSGTRCTNGYVTHPFCSPTRAGLLAGRYQQRFGHEYNPVYDPLDPTEGLPLSEKLLPNYLKEKGYATGWVGKWHLGSSPDHVPWKRGFDETFGFIGGGHQFIDWTPNERQYTLPITRNGKAVAVSEHLTKAFGDEAASFVRRHKSSPWMLYLAFNAPHTPHQPTREREARFASVKNPARRRCLAQISLLDDAVGTVLDALAESGQTEKTLVFFLGDNGGPVAQAADNGDLRGAKGQLYEGGIRVPFVVSWPGHLPAGRNYDQPVSSLDILATAVAISGASTPRDRKLDGVDLVPYLSGERTTPPHERLFWRSGAGQARAVREGRWKLVKLRDKPAELFDLVADRTESRDLAADKPEVAARLSEALAAWDRELKAPVFLGSSVKSEDWGPGGANQKSAAKAKKKAAPK